MVAFLLLLSPGSRGSEPEPFTVGQALELPEAELALRKPRVFRGMLTFHEPGHRMAFLQDPTGSIYLEIQDSQPASAGDEVEVTGIVNSGIDGRNLSGLEAGRSPLIRTIGKGRWPEAVPVTAADVISGKCSSLWSQVDGRIRSVEAAGDRVRLGLEGYPELPVYIAGMTRQAGLPGHLQGLRVRISGVPAAALSSTEPPVMQRVMLVPSLHQVEVDAADRRKRFDVPEAKLHDLMWIPSDESIRRFSKVRGVVTLVRPGRGFYLQRGTSSAWVQCSEPDSPALDDRVECSGIPGGYHGAGMLRDAMWQPFGELLAPIEAVRLPMGEMLADPVHGRIAELEGVVVESFKSPGEEILIVSTGDSSFSARLPAGSLPAGFSTIERGSRVRVSGVCVNRPSPAVDSIGNQESLQILSRDAADLKVLALPPFWNTRRLVWLLAGLLLLFSAAGIWVVALRRQVRRQEAIIRRQAVHEDRLRIAREWHDTFEQHFAGITMQLDAAATVIPPGTAPRKLLERAARMADHSRAEARHAIWDLRLPGAGESDSFLDELEKSLRAGWPEEGVPCLEIRGDHAAGPLPRDVTAHLLRIAHEAVANAFKHASASTVSVTWSDRPEGFELKIEDDGKGIPTEEIGNASARGHFGLLGLKERACKLNARLRIDSPPHGKANGTEVVLELSRASLNLS